MIPFLFFYTEEQKLMVNHGVIDDYSGFITFSIFAFIISGISYVAVTYRLLKKYNTLTRQNFAFSDSIDLNWLKFFISGMGVIFIVATIVIILEEGIGVVFGFNTDPIFFVLIIAFIFLLGYSGIRHKNIFTEQVNENPRIVEPKTSGEYKDPVSKIRMLNDTTNSSSG